MSYVSRVLQPGETIIYFSRLHALIYLPGLLLLVLALIILVLGSGFQSDFRYVVQGIAAAIALLGIASCIRAAIRRATTELAVTDRRVIYKSGLFSRHTLEMNRSKVESVDVDQSVIGRLFGFGTITVRGTGGSLEPIRLIGDPLTFRSHITAL